MTNPILSIQNLKVAMQSNTRLETVVDDISFTVNQGETFALLGESGCGKTTTALAIMQLLPLAARFIGNGHVFCEQTDLLTLSDVQLRQWRGRKIGMIFQEPMSALNPVMSIGAQIAEVLQKHTSLRGKAQKERVIELLANVGLSSPRKRYNQYPYQLSGGMKQRVMIAEAIAAQPTLLIADEPTTALDVTIQTQIIQLLQKLQQETGMAILLISHDLGMVRQFANRVAVMYAGRIIEEATTEVFFNSPLHPYSQKLFEVIPNYSKRNDLLSAIPGYLQLSELKRDACLFANRCHRVFERCRQEKPFLLSVEQNHQVSCHLYDNPTQNNVSPPVLSQRSLTESSSRPHLQIEVKDMQVYFAVHKGILQRKVGNLKAVDGVSLRLFSGQTLALVGESGCGKTTLAKAMLNLVKATSGEAFFERLRQPLNFKKISPKLWRSLRQDISIIFQDPFASLDPRMLIEDIVLEGVVAQGRSKKRAHVESILEAVGLSPESRDRYPHEFSGGQRQRIGIARALAVKPKVIICDEPTSSLDLSVQAQILNLLKTLQREYGLSYLFITHNISVVAYMANFVAVMYLGRIVEQGPVEAVLQKPKHPYTQALLAAIPDISAHHDSLTAVLPGEPPSPEHPPSGCHFHPRCPFVMPKCSQEYPEVTNCGNEHWARCYLLDE